MELDRGSNALIVIVTIEALPFFLTLASLHLICSTRTVAPDDSAMPDDRSGLSFPLT